ncbi:MAG: type II secretion system F family protein [Syntrophobacteraceae bacterium]|nr:type II secretion system F family protein [Syntrophobacteraceae bacterium]
MSETGLFPIAAAALLFVSILLFYIGVYRYSNSLARRKKMLARVQDSETGFTGEELGAGDSVSFFGVALHILRAVGRFAVRTDKKVDITGKRLAFLRAGIRGENAPFTFWGTKYVSAVLLGVLFVFTRSFTMKEAKLSLTLLVGLCLVTAGFYIPEVWLRLKTSSRKEKIRNALPDALDLLVVCVEAGMGLDQAISRVGEEMKLTCTAVSEEFKLFTLEVRAGKAKRDAMKGLAIRTDLDDVSSLVTLLIQAEKFGTSVAQSLRVYSDAFRTRRVQKAEEAAAKLPVKMLLPLGLFILPCLFIVVLGPAALKIYHQLSHLMTIKH